MEYDDGVYYAAARALLHGLVPYRAFTLVQPPLTSALLLPAALLGQTFGDPLGMAAARVEVLLVECVNVWLIHQLTRGAVRGSERARRVAATVAAAVYAVAPGAVAAGHTVFLEPLTNLFVLLAMCCLLRRPLGVGAATFGGGLLAAALGVKAFAAVYVVVTAVWLLGTGRGRLLPAAGGFLAAAALIFAPVAALAGVPTMWRDVVTTQLTRPSDGDVSLVERAVGLFGVATLHAAGGLAVASSCVIGVAWVAFPARRRGVPPPSQMWVWAAAAALIIVAFLGSPSYFDHYAAFFTPPFAIVLGATVGLSSFGSRPVQIVTPAVVSVLLVVAAVGSLRGDQSWRGGPSIAAAVRQVPAHACVYSDAVSLLIAADRFRLPDRACPGWLDGRGQNLLWRSQPAPVDFYPRGFLVDAQWQAQTLRQLEAATYLLVRSDPRRMPEWTARLRVYVADHFRPVWIGTGRVPAQLWTRIS